MRAAVLRGGRIVVDDVPEPVPGRGQVLLETVACGICGSDLHAVRHGADLVASSKACGMALFDYDPDDDLVMGHEIVARVLEVGSGVDGLRPGTVVAPHPVVRLPGGAVRSVGYANDWPGGYAQRFVVDAPGCVPVPDGVAPELFALTEPLAVGLHAVRRSRAVALGSAVVLGCGPVGLAIVANLVAAGVPLVVGADFSPTRRRFATALGAQVVVDPADTAPLDAWRHAGGRGATVVVDAIGVPGTIDLAMQAAPRSSEILVAGLCMQTDRFWPAIGINKELSISFVLGWNETEFAESMRAIADGRIDAAALVTAEVGLDGVAGAFDTLARPDEHVKILVRPNG